MDWWANWWIWGLLGLGLVLLEVLVPALFFLGFAIGAAVTALLLFAGGPFGVYLAESLPALMLTFGCFSLVGWLAVRRLLGVRKGQVKIIDRDINED